MGLVAIHASAQLVGGHPDVGTGTVSTVNSVYHVVFVKHRYRILSAFVQVSDCIAVRYSQLQSAVSDYLFDRRCEAIDIRDRSIDSGPVCIFDPSRLAQ